MAQIADLYKMFRDQQAKAEKGNQKAVRLKEMTVAFEKQAAVTLVQLPSIMASSDPTALTRLAQIHHLLEQ